MGVIESCAGSTVGVDTMACYSAAAEYLPGYLMLAGLFILLYMRLSIEPTRDRIAASLLVVSIVAMFFAAMGFVPESAWTPLLVLTIGSGAILAIKRE